MTVVMELISHKLYFATRCIRYLRILRYSSIIREKTIYFVH